jgi:hypothetical protein
MNLSKEPTLIGPPHVPAIANIGSYHRRHEGLLESPKTIAESFADVASCALIAGRDWFIDNGRGLALPGRAGQAAAQVVTLALDALLLERRGCRWRAVRSPTHRDAYRGGDCVDQ